MCLCPPLAFLPCWPHSLRLCANTSGHCQGCVILGPSESLCLCMFLSLRPWGNFPMSLKPGYFLFDDGLSLKNCSSVWSCFKMFAKMLFFNSKIRISKTLSLSLFFIFRRCFSKLNNFSRSFWHLQTRPEFQTSRGFPKMFPKWSLVSSYICIRSFLWWTVVSYPLLEFFLNKRR